MELDVTNKVISPEVPCDECMDQFCSGSKSSDFLVVYCYHRFCVALYSPANRRWEVRIPISPAKLESWIENNRDFFVSDLWGRSKKRRREAISAIAALDRLEGSISSFAGVH